MCFCPVISKHGILFKQLRFNWEEGGPLFWTKTHVDTFLLFYVSSEFVMKLSNKSETFDYNNLHYIVFFSF